MGKLIIRNQTMLNDITALTLVSRIVKNGRISNNGKQYCYLTCFEIEKRQYHIITNLRKCSDVFIIYEVKTT